jgi:hypothetical protein
MKYTNIFTVLLLTASFSCCGLLADTKRYQVKSGIVEYQISGGGNIMGINSETKGESKLIFKDWGNLELHDEKSSTTTLGHTETNHNITKIDHAKFYSVDFEKRVIIEHSPELLKQMSDKDMTKMGKEMMESMGGKKIGNEKLLGYNCEIWEMMDTKTWIYKGIPLKSEANIMGMKHLQVATKAKFNISISNKEFKLPNFPKKINNRQIPQGDIPQNMPSSQEIKQMQEMMKNFGNMGK